MHTPVSQSRLARELGMSRQGVNKMVKAGVFDKCLDHNGKLILEKAIPTYHKSLVGNRKSGLVIKDTSQKGVTSTVNASDSRIYNADNLKELKALLDEEVAPLKKVQIESTFWQAKTRRLDFLESEGDLIPLGEAKQIMEAVFTPINTDLNDLPYKLRANFPDTQKEAVEWLLMQIDEIKTKSYAAWI